MTGTTPELLTSNEITSSKGVIYMSDPKLLSDFENLYLKVRKKEGRIYPDSVVKNLPNVSENHSLSWEWQIRAKSMDKFIAYLKRKPMKIIDLGCGNGWLSNRLAQIGDCMVYAIDLNAQEIEQGARIFSDTNSLQFVYGNVFDGIFQPAGFDLILLASSVQYFPDLKSLFKRLIKLLGECGEIHIIDSPFYTKKSVISAKQRTVNYYHELGYPEMANHYYHHLWSDLTGFKYKIKYNPDTFFCRLKHGFTKKILSPFPWIVIQS